MAAQKTTNRKWLLALIALVVIAAILATVYLITRPDAAEGEKTVTVKVVHADQSEKDFTYETDDEYLGELLLDEELAEGETSEYGMYITKVDGEQTVLDDGDEFSLVYTKDAS